jgi:hypothetical protein
MAQQNLVNNPAKVPAYNPAAPYPVLNPDAVQLAVPNVPLLVPNNTLYPRP